MPSFTAPGVFHAHRGAVWRKGDASRNSKYGDPQTRATSTPGANTNAQLITTYFILSRARGDVIQLVWFCYLYWFSCVYITASARSMKILAFVRRCALE